MQLRKHLEAGIGVILSELDAQRCEVAGQAQLTRLAQAVCTDVELAPVLGEIFHIIGESGGLEIRTGQGRKISHEYVEGSYWEGGVLSSEMILDKQRLRTDLEMPAILATDYAIEEPRQLVPLLDTAIGAGISSLLLIAQSMTAEALSLLLAIPNRRRILVIAVKAPPITDKGALEDIAMLSGGRAIRRETGQSLREVTLTDLGRARHAWTDKTYFSLTGGGGDPRALRKHLDGLREAQGRAKTLDERQELQKRMGKLFGGAANLYLGAATESEIEVRKALAERATEALRGAIRDGVVPGAGTALLACRPALQQRLTHSGDVDEQAAYRILMRAMEEPMRVIAANAGYDPDAVLARVLDAPSGYGFDAEAGGVVEMATTGLLDAAATLKAAVHAGVGGAAMALTTGALVHHKKLQQEFAP
jgi:chaperonin GroEL